MLDCDRKLEVLIAALSSKGTKPVGKLSKPRIKTKPLHTSTFDVRTALYGLLGVDLTEIHGPVFRRKTKNLLGPTAGEEDIDVCQRGKSTISEYSLSPAAIEAER